MIMDIASSSTFSYNTNIMLAAIISLLVVILLFLLLHLYAARYCFLATRRSSISSSTSRRASSSRVLGPSRFHHLHSTTELLLSNGLHPSVISSIPVFVYKFEQLDNDDHHVPECVICLSVFEDDEIGRKLPKCDHAFHVDCIDMWLASHDTCPICRAPVDVVMSSYENTDNHDKIIINEARDDHELSLFGESTVLDIVIENLTSSSGDDSLVDHR